MTAQRNRIYRERDRLENARTVAAMISEQSLANVNDNGPQPFAAADDVSTITASANTQANQQRMASQITLDNISQALNRRRSIGAYHMISHRRISAARKQNPQKKAIQTC